MLLWSLLAAALVLSSLALLLAASSRHKKSAMGELHLLGQWGRADSPLTPEGAVLVNGELWRARLRGGGEAVRGARVRVVGAAGHLLEVETEER